MLRRLAPLSVLLTLALGAAAALTPGPDFSADIAKQFGAAAARRIASWQRLMDFAQDFAEEEKLKMVNDFFNSLTFIDDRGNWGVDDYWATPVEFLTKNGGDCEDFAIAKYFTLIAVAVPEERLRLTYVKALHVNQSHMVLTYFPSPHATPLVLDNLNPQILPASQRTDLVPVYSFNGSGLWLAKAIGAGKRIDDAQRLDAWSKLNARLRATMPAAADGRRDAAPAPRPAPPTQ